MIKPLIHRYISIAGSLKDLPPLIFRLILAYGFFEPAMNKVKNFDSIVEWFDKSLGLPFPELNAYMATGTEVVGIILLLLGLATRFISVPLMVVMVVAITTVHLEHGYACSKNGFEVPFYYFFMLFSLLVTGAGRLSVDAILAKKN